MILDYGAASLWVGYSLVLFRSFGGSLFLRFGEGGKAGFKELVVPLEELTDVASVDTVLVIVRHYGSEILTELFLASDSLDVYGFAVIGHTDSLKHLGKRSIAAIISVYGDVTERHHFVTCIGRCALACGERFDYEHVLALIDKTEKAGTARYRQNFTKHD